jgi:RNA-dependent RNA polymerase
VLDAAKSGKRVRKDVLAKDSKDWDILDRPEWTKPVESKVSSAGRSKTLDGGFTPAMAYIRRESLKKRQELLEQYTEMTQSRTKDQDLCAPWEKDVKRVDTIPDQEGAASLRRELEAIRLHVETQYKNRKTNQTAFTSRPIRDRQDMLRAESRAFASGPAGIIYHSEKDVIELKASYAYILDSNKSTNGWSRWPWNVAMNELCRIKAGSGSTGSTQFRDDMTQFMKMSSLKHLPPILVGS